MNYGVRDLYPIALAEGEGVGTAYEYFAKQRVLIPILRELPVRPRILIAGLPEKYGSSLDLILVGWLRGGAVTVIDERPAAFEKLSRGIENARAKGLLPGFECQMKTVPSMVEPKVEGPFDLVVSCEVLQRLPAGDRERHTRWMSHQAPISVLFAPNRTNASHLKLSGLDGVTCQELRSWFGPSAVVGLVDMPPFPPGITRSAEQRQQASSGWKEQLAMEMLEAYCKIEPTIPEPIAAQFAHIAYAVDRRSA